MEYRLIGAIQAPTGKTIVVDDFEQPELVTVEGYHVNVLNVEDSKLSLIQAYIIEVATPSAVFAGRDDTICLRFTNRDEWLALGIENQEEIPQ